MGTDVRRYELPYGASAPAIVNVEAGIRRLVARGDGRSYAMEVTVLDAPDHRLVRAGVLLAHRLVDGVGEWYLAAPSWEPFLPAEAVEAVGEDLPQEFAQLILPFRRGAALGPVAGMACERREYQVRGDDDVVVAELRDDKVTVSRGGLTTARYREVTLTCVDGTAEQLAWIDEALLLVGGTPREDFPTFVERLGAPATGMSDLPVKRRGHGNDTMESYVQAIVGGHLHALFAADLALRSRMAKGRKPMLRAVAALRADLRGLYPVLDGAWLTSLLDDLDDVAGAFRTDAGKALVSERYLSILDRLVTASRAPRVGDVARRPAAEVLSAELKAVLRTLTARMDVVKTGGTDEAWEGALTTSQNLAALAAVCEPVLGKKARRLAEVAEELVDELLWCTETSTVVPESFEGMEPAEIFEAGRTFERETLVQDVAREDFAATWSKAKKALKALEPK